MDKYTQAWMSQWGTKLRLTDYDDSDRCVMSWQLYKVGTRDRDAHKQAMKLFSRTFGETHMIKKAPLWKAVLAGLWAGIRCCLPGNREFVESHVACRKEVPPQ